MALLDKDIIITSNKGQTAEPKIEFIGADAAIGAQSISLNVYPTSNGTLSFEGSSGQLFSITNDLTGTLFSVSDVSGIPSIEVDADGTISLAEFGGNVGIGTRSPAATLDIIGTLIISGAATFGGNITVSGTVDGRDVSADGTKLDAIATGANNYTLPEATTSALGGIELFSDTDQAIAANAVSTTAGRTYGLQLNSAGQAVVNVPWVDTNTTYGVATSAALGLVEVFSDTDQTVAANAVSATAGRTYGIQLNAANQMVVNVPWVNAGYTHPNDGVDLVAALTGANVISDVNVNALGHVTGFSTRALTPANIGAAANTNVANWDAAYTYKQVGHLPLAGGTLSGDVNGTSLTLTGDLTASTKAFLIEHPTKPGMKLRHGSLEGPENGVYIRGRITDINVIELPEYWLGLVHEESITVSLTPIGRGEHWVENIKNNSVIIGADRSINCFYTVFAERKDVDKLEVEYK
jgi:hypothetical protein